MSSTTKRFEGDFLMLLWIFILLDLSPNEFMFQEVIFSVSSGDFKGEVFSGIIGSDCGGWFQLTYFIITR